MLARSAKTTLTSNMTEFKNLRFKLTYNNFDPENVVLQGFETKTTADDKGGKVTFLRAPVKYTTPKGAEISCSFNGPVVLMSRGLKREMSKGIEKWKCCIKVDPNDPEFGPEGMKLIKVVEQARDALKPEIKANKAATKYIGVDSIEHQVRVMTGGFVRSGEKKGTATEDSARYLYCDVIHYVDETGKVSRAQIKKLKLNPETRKPETKPIKEWSQLIGTDESGDPFMDLIGIPTLKISYVTLAAGKVKMNVTLTDFTIIETREARSFDRHKEEIEDLLASDPSFMGKLEAELAKAKAVMPESYSAKGAPASSEISFGDDTDSPQQHDWEGTSGEGLADAINRMKNSDA